MSYGYNTGSSGRSTSNATSFGSAETDILPEQTIPETNNNTLSEVAGMGNLSEPINTDELDEPDVFSKSSDRLDSLASTASSTASTVQSAVGEATTSITSSLTETFGEPNVHPTERIASGVAGVALATYAITKQHNLGGALLALAGGFLVFRGATGHCFGYALMNTSTNNTTGSGDVTSPTKVISHGHGIKVERTVSITKPADELYDFWRNFENLPRFMEHLNSVSVQDSNKSHWVAKAPLGTSVEWDAEIINEVPGELIAWKSLEGAQIPNAGSVRFKTLPAGRGTEVKVTLEYNPPLGVIGEAFAKLFGEEPKGQIHSDLARFKALIEAGEIPTSAASPEVPTGPMTPAVTMLPA